MSIAIHTVRSIAHDSVQQHYCVVYKYIQTYIQTTHICCRSILFARCGVSCRLSCWTFVVCWLCRFMRACYLRLFFIQGHCHVIANNLYFTAFSTFCLCYWHRFNALSIYFWLITFSQNKSYFKAGLFIESTQYRLALSLHISIYLPCHPAPLCVVTVRYSTAARQWAWLRFDLVALRIVLMDLWAPIQWLAEGRS